MSSRNQISFISKYNINLDETTSNNLVSFLRANEYDFGPSLHEKLINQYMETSKLEQSLMISLRSTFEGDLVPKNPYPLCIRSLNATNIQKEAVQNFANVIKFMSKNLMEPLGPYGITNIKNKSKFFGLPHVLEYIDADKLENARKALLNFLPDYRNQEGNTRIVVSSSLSGGYLIYSNLFPYPNTSPFPIIITSEIFIEAYGLEKAAELYANYVYEDAMSIANPQDNHIFQYFFIEISTDKETMKKKWTKEEIMTNRNPFITMLKACVKQKARHFLNIYLLTKKFDDMQLRDDERDISTGRIKNNLYNKDNFDTNFNFIKTRKMYNLHFTDKEKKDLKESYASLPLASLLKGVFVNQEFAYMYASFFYKDKENYGASKQFKVFADKSLAGMFQKWKAQSYLQTTFEFFFNVLTIQNDDLKRKLLDNIIQILSSEQAFLYSLAKYNKTLRLIITEYQKTSIPYFMYCAIHIFKIYQQNLKEILAKAGTSEIINFKKHITKQLGSLVDDKTHILEINWKTLITLKSLYRVTKTMSEANLQLVAVASKNLPEFIYQTFEKANLIKDYNEKKKKQEKEREKRRTKNTKTPANPNANNNPDVNGVLKDFPDIFTFSEMMNRKKAHRVLHISKEVSRLSKQPEFAKMNDMAIEERLFLNYVNEFEIFDYLYITIRDIFFNPQVPNPIPVVSHRMEYQSYKFEIKEIPMDELRLLLNEPTEDQTLIYKEKRYPNVYKFQNQQMKNINIFIIATRDILSVIAAVEIALFKIKKFSYVYEDMHGDLQIFMGMHGYRINICKSIKEYSQCFANFFNGLAEFIDIINRYFDEISWEKAITKLSQNYEVSGIFSISYHSIFSHSSIQRRTYPEWNVIFDFFIKGANFDSACQIFYDILIKYTLWLHKRPDVTVIGFFLETDPLNPFLDINYLLANAETTLPRDNLQNQFIKNEKRIYLKIITKIITNVDIKFKNINIYINLHYINPTTLKTTELLSFPKLDDKIKIFFKEEDFYLWNRLYPFNKGESEKFLNDKISTDRSLGKLSTSYKSQFLKYSTEGNTKIMLRLFRALFSVAEAFFVLSKEAESLAFVLQIIFRNQESPQIQPKVRIDEVEGVYLDFRRHMILKVLTYHNYHMEGIHPKLIELTNTVLQVFEEIPSIKIYEAQKKMLKIADICTTISESALLSFETSIFEKDTVKVVQQYVYMHISSKLKCILHAILRDDLSRINKTCFVGNLGKLTKSLHTVFITLNFMQAVSQSWYQLISHIKQKNLFNCYVKQFIKTNLSLEYPIIIIRIFVLAIISPHS